MPITELNVENVQDATGPLLISGGLSASGFEQQFRQINTSIVVNIGSVAIAFPNHIGKKNNLIIIIVKWQPSSGANTITVSTITDTLGSTYTQVGSNVFTGTAIGGISAGVAVFTAPTTGEGANTVTITFSGTVTGSIVTGIYEMYGSTDTAPTVEAFVTNTGSGTTITSGTVTSTTDYDWLVELSSANPNATITVPSGWIARAPLSGGSPRILDKAADVAGNYSFSATTVSSDWASVLLAIKTNEGVARGGYGNIGRLFVRNVINEGNGTLGQAPTWPSLIFPGGYRGNTYSYVWDLYPASSPTTYSVTSGSLPTGLSLSNLGGDQGQVSGTPTAIGTFSFTLLATNAYGTASQSFSITISTAVAETSHTFILS